MNILVHLVYHYLQYSFVLFFPQLVSGPIIYYKELIPALTHGKICLNMIVRGGILISIGLFKKIVLADNFNSFFDNKMNMFFDLSFFDMWKIIFFNAFQFYFDFSGYIDLALGSALLFGVKLPINFNSPLRASNIQELWRNWHITLTRFLKKNIYIPLGGNHHGVVRLIFSILVTFVIAGVWHGAGWNYILWGAINGIGMILFFIWRNLNIKVPYVFSWGLTFLFFSISLILLRIDRIEMVQNLLMSLVSFEEVLFAILFDFKFFSMENFFLVTAFIIILQKENTNIYLDSIKSFQFKHILVTIVSLLLSAYYYLRVGTTNEFIYFNF